MLGFSITDCSLQEIYGEIKYQVYTPIKDYMVELCKFLYLRMQFLLSSLTLAQRLAWESRSELNFELFLSCQETVN